MTLREQYTLCKITEWNFPHADRRFQEHSAITVKYRPVNMTI